MLADNLLNVKEKNKETGDSRHIYKNKPDKTCFQHEMAYRHLKHLPRRTTLYYVIKNPKL